MKTFRLKILVILFFFPFSSLAQSNNLTPFEKWMGSSKTEKDFNIMDLTVNVRGIVNLKEGKMILDLTNIKYYDDFKHLDSILIKFRSDIAFYKDSLDARGEGHWRIDYVVTPDLVFRKLRFKKYNPDGDIFVYRNDDLAKLKMEQDTINIIIQKDLEWRHLKQRTVIGEATFYLDNYTDIDKVIAGKNELRHIIDTLEHESQGRGMEKAPYSHQLTLMCNPHGKDTIYISKLNGVVMNNLMTNTGRRQRNYIDVYGNLGAGLVMNTLAPSGDLGLVYKHIWGHSNEDVSFARLFASSYYFFERNSEGDITIKDNWFLNCSIGSEYGKSGTGWLGSICDIGAGYLVVQKGNYFTNTTVKVFTDIKFGMGLILSPEVIATNNFKQFYPGITMKVF